MSEERKITPVIKAKRTRTEEYEVCPHCQKKIVEKSLYVDAENYVFHRPCLIAGPIDKIQPCKIEWTEKGIRCASTKTADVTTTHTVSGYFDQNIAGVDYELEYSATLGDPAMRFPDEVEVEKPEEMPDDIWDQAWEGLEEIALAKAYDQLRLQRKADTDVRLIKISKKGEEKPKDNPFAICNEAVGTEKTPKRERCIKDIKKKMAEAIASGLVKVSHDVTNEAFYCLLAGMPESDVAKRYPMEAGDWAEIHQMIEVAGKGLPLAELRKRIRKESLPMAFQPLWDSYHPAQPQVAATAKGGATKEAQDTGMGLRSFLCEMFEMTSGIARREIEEGLVWVNGQQITDPEFLVHDDDIVETKYEVAKYNGKVQAKIPDWWKRSKMGLPHQWKTMPS